MPHPSSFVSRRECLQLALAGAVGGSLAGSSLAAGDDTAARDASPTFRFCLNTSTIREQGLTLADEVALVARLGYDGIEPWMGEIDKHVEEGGSLADLRKQIEDAGIAVESAIGFANWIVDDETQRAEGIEQLKRDMDSLRQIGGTRIAAPPVGAHQGDAPVIDLLAIAERYHHILDAGRDIGVTPQLEVWGFSKNLSRLGETMYVAVEAGHPDAIILPDIYHLFRGGSPFEGVELIAGSAIQVFHLNDYPDGRPRTEYNDADRVFCGDGVAPIRDVLMMLKANGCQCALSLELFNRDYWQRPAEEVAREGLEKMKAVAEGV
jgi:sugar phosphate isomerase/epimerase